MEKVWFLSQHIILCRKFNSTFASCHVQTNDKFMKRKLLFPYDGGLMMTLTQWNEFLGYAAATGWLADWLTDWSRRRDSNRETRTGMKDQGRGTRYRQKSIICKVSFTIFLLVLLLLVKGVTRFGEEEAKASNVNFLLPRLSKAGGGEGGD